MRTYYERSYMRGAMTGAMMRGRPPLILFQGGSGEEPPQALRNTGCYGQKSRILSLSPLSLSVTLPSKQHVEEKGKLSRRNWYFLRVMSSRRKKHTPAKIHTYRL